MRSSLPIFPCKRSNTWLVTKCVRVNTCHGNPNRMGHDPQRTEYRSLMDMTWHLGATKIWGPPIPSLMLFDADSWLSQSATAPNSLFNPIFLYHIAQNGCYIMVYPVKSPAQKGKKKTALLRNLGQALKSGLPCSLKGFVWDIHQGRAKTNQLNTPGILCILRSVGSCFFLRRDSSIELICLFQKWGIPANYQFMGNIMINHGLLGCTVFRSN